MQGNAVPQVLVEAFTREAEMTETLPEPIEVAVARVEPGCTVEEIALARTMVHSLERRAKELREQLEAAIIGWMQDKGTETLAYTADDQGNQIIVRLDHDKVTKCRDVRKTFQTLAGMDLSIVEDCLSSSAFKYGAMKKLIAPELWNELFEVEVRTKLKDGTPAPKKLQTIDTRFIK